MAKIGYLYLKQGKWDGKQILPAQWVQDSTKRQAGPDPGFGYQWRVAQPEGFNAVGWGSQLIAVAPAKDLVVVMTAGVAPGGPGAGIEGSVFQTISQRAVVDKGDGALPANPEALARLKQLSERAAQPEPRGVPALPAVADQITGKLYRLADNTEGLKTLKLTFQEKQATLDFDTDHGRRTLVVGLDNVYRESQVDGERTLARGGWQDAQTFVVEEQVLGAADKTTYTLKFNGDRVDGDLAAYIEEHRVELHGTVTR